MQRRFQSVETSGSLVEHFRESPSFLLSASARTRQCGCWARRTRIAASGIQPRQENPFRLGFKVNSRREGACSQRRCGESPRAKLQRVFVGRPQDRSSWADSEAEFQRCGQCWSSSQQHIHSVSAHLRASTVRGSLFPCRWAFLRHRTTQACRRQRTTHRCRRPHITLVCRLKRSGLSEPTQHAGVPTASHGLFGRSAPTHHSGLFGPTTSSAPCGHAGKFERLTAATGHLFRGHVGQQSSAWNCLPCSCRLPMQTNSVFHSSSVPSLSSLCLTVHHQFVRPVTFESQRLTNDSQMVPPSRM